MTDSISVPRNVLQAIRDDLDDIDCCAAFWDVHRTTLDRLLGKVEAER